MRRTRGYTLVELVVSVAIGMVLIGLVMRWGLGVTTVAAKSMLSDNQGDLSLVTDRFDADMLAGVACEPLGSIVRQVGPGNLTVFADLQGDGILEAISWKVENNTVSRAVDPVSGCTGPSIPTWVPLASGLDGALAPVVDGQVNHSVSLHGDCTRVLDSRCRIQSFNLKLVRDKLGGWAETTSHLGP